MQKCACQWSTKFKWHTIAVLENYNAKAQVKNTGCVWLPKWVKLREQNSDCDQQPELKRVMQKCTCQWNARFKWRTMAVLENYNAKAQVKNTSCVWLPKWVKLREHNSDCNQQPELKSAMQKCAHQGSARFNWYTLAVLENGIATTSTTAPWRVKLKEQNSECSYWLWIVCL